MRKESYVYFDRLWDSGKRCFSDLDEEEKAKLSGFLMKEYPAISQHEFICESSNSQDLYDAVIDFLILMDEFGYDMQEKKEDSIKNMHKAIIDATSSYAKFMIDAMFETEYKTQKQLHDDRYDDLEGEIRRGLYITRSDNYETRTAT